jgi:hypothetical protein
MQLDKFWSVKARNGHKRHLMKFRGDEGTPEVTLCGNRIPLNNRLGSSRTVLTPSGDECAECLLKSGHAEEKRIAKNKRVAARAKSAKLNNQETYFFIAYLACDQQLRNAETKAREAGIESESELRRVRQEVWDKKFARVLGEADVDNAMCGFRRCEWSVPTRCE